MSQDPFSSPGTGTKLDMAKLNGRLLLIKPTSHEENVPTVNGDKDAIRAEIVVLDGNDAGEVYSDALIFSSGLIPQLKGRIGKQPPFVLGRLGQRPTNFNQPAWHLNEATEADKDVARKHLAAADPFA